MNDLYRAWKGERGPTQTELTALQFHRDTFRYHKEDGERREEALDRRYNQVSWSVNGTLPLYERNAK